MALPRQTAPSSMRGYDAAEGSLMAKLNVRGNEMMEQMSKDWISHSKEMVRW